MIPEEPGQPQEVTEINAPKKFRCAQCNGLDWMSEGIRVLYEKVQTIICKECDKRIFTEQKPKTMKVFMGGEKQ